MGKLDNDKYTDEQIIEYIRLSHVRQYKVLISNLMLRFHIGWNRAKRLYNLKDDALMLGCIALKYIAKVKLHNLTISTNQLSIRYDLGYRRATRIFNLFNSIIQYYSNTKHQFTIPIDHNAFLRINDDNYKNKKKNI